MAGALRLLRRPGRAPPVPGRSISIKAAMKTIKLIGLLVKLMAGESETVIRVGAQRPPLEDDVGGNAVLGGVAPTPRAAGDFIVGVVGRRVLQ